MSKLSTNYTLTLIFVILVFAGNVFSEETRESWRRNDAKTFVSAFDLGRAIHPENEGQARELALNVERVGVDFDIDRVSMGDINIVIIGEHKTEDPENTSTGQQLIHNTFDLAASVHPENSRVNPSTSILGQISSFLNIGRRETDSVVSSIRDDASKFFKFRSKQGKILRNNDLEELNEEGFIDEIINASEENSPIHLDLENELAEESLLNSMSWIGKNNAVIVANKDMAKSLVKHFVCERNDPNTIHTKISRGLSVREFRNENGRREMYSEDSSINCNL